MIIRCLFKFCVKQKENYLPVISFLHPLLSSGTTSLTNKKKGILSLFNFTNVSSDDSLDWKDYGVDDIVKRVVESDKLNNGAIILMHNGAKYTADALESVITGLQDKGYELVPISQLIYKDKYHMKADGTQVSGE